MLSIVYALPIFFNHIEKRKGIQLHDWLLAAVTPHNVSPIIFTFIWGMILLIFVRALYKPVIYINYCWTLMFVSIFRLTCISLVPLQPPIGLVPLTDPLTGVFYGQALITKDLFFSGHTATLVLIYLCLEKKRDKQIALFSVIAVGVLLVIQHIHYTIDILAAPVFTYASFKIARFILTRNGIRNFSRLLVRFFL